VFVDRSGRRRRLVVASGAAFAVLVLLALTMLIAGLFGASPVPLPGLPDLVGPAPTQSTPGQDERDGSGSTPTGPSVPEPMSTGATTAPDPVLPTNANQTSPPRHIPTQTPTDRGKPTKT
jgi:hypothetical protein